jgi:WhiB family redox-sensing transcriptional regulator
MGVMFAPLEETTNPDDRTWWAKARCNDGAATMTALFFSEELHDIARAKLICSKCAVRVPCLEGALARREPWGVWGGELLLNGKILANKRKRGRPPKNPRPEPELLDEVPIPPHLLPQREVRTA